MTVRGVKGNNLLMKLKDNCMHRTPKEKKVRQLNQLRSKDLFYGLYKGLLHFFSKQGEKMKDKDG